MDGVIFGALLGMAGTLGAGIVSQEYKSRVERQALATAIAAEILAISLLVRRRGYLNAIEKVRDTPTNIFRLPMEYDYFQVYKAHISRLGILPLPLPAQIVTFYTHAQSVCEDLDTKLPLERAGEDQRFSFYDQLADLLKDTLSLGELLILQLNAVPFWPAWLTWLFNDRCILDVHL